jgi:hypothetical protein
LALPSKRWQHSRKICWGHNVSGGMGGDKLNNMVKICF